MKQKNMVLIAVAVACGLVAAVLTSQISAGNKGAKSEETVAVLVAAKELPVGTWLKKDTINDFVVVKDFPVASAPQVFIANVEDLADKRVVRTIRKGDSFNPKDVSKSAAIAPPDGYGMMSIPCTLDETVTGFVQPGSKVNILASIPSRRSGDKVTVVTFLSDMLVLAVDGSSTIQTENPVNASVGTVSFAVTSSTAELLHAAKTRGCNMRLILVGQTPMVSEDKPLTHKQLWALLADMPPAESNGSGDGDPKAKKEDTVKLVVAREDIPAGTQLTQEVIDTLFDMKEFAKPAPANGIENVRESTGKFVTKDLAAGQFLPKSFLGADPKAAPKAGPTDGSTSKEAADEPLVKKERELPPVFHDVTITTGSGSKRIRYQVLPSGDYKFIGEVPVATAPDKVPAPDEKPEAKPAPKAAPKPPKSGEPAKGGDSV